MTQQVQQHTLTALFDSRAEAARAVEHLVEAGISHAEIQVLSGEAGAHARPAGQAGHHAALEPLALPHEDRHAYAEGMSRGGVMLAVRVDPGEVERAAAILERNNSVNLEEREARWRQEGWQGYQAAGTASAATGGREVIPVVEETLRVGKRQVVQGRVRVRLHVVEVPVTAEVQLREEHVRIERHPVGRTLTAEEEAKLLRERTIEVEEVAEVPVVEKVPVIKEEIVIAREAAERTETVQDRVRRTEVEVEDETESGRSTGSTGRGGR